MLFVDQPVGTGYSYVNGDGYVTDEQQMASEMVILLQTFFGSIRPDLAKNEFFIFGESYGGK
jgi:carboxypeptidase C (cathepsin A)